MKTVGIDIAKDKFDAWCAGTHRQFKNNSRGFLQLVKWAGAEPHYVMEATGGYFLALAHFLHTQEIKLSVVNPLVIKRYSQTLQKRAKTDAVDAQLLADFGARMQPRLWAPPSATSSQLRQLHRTRQLLLTQKTALTNQLTAFALDPNACSVAVGILKQNIREFNKNLATLNVTLAEKAEQAYPVVYQKLKSIPGLGLQNTALLLCITDGFTRFDSSKQLASYVGISPSVIESGKMKIKSVSINKMGMSAIRQMLYLAALSASQFNPPCKELYQRLVSKGKAKKLALIAVAHKLLRQAFAVAKSLKDFNTQLNLDTNMAST